MCLTIKKIINFFHSDLDNHRNRKKKQDSVFAFIRFSSNIVCLRPYRVRRMFPFLRIRKSIKNDVPSTAYFHSFRKKKMLIPNAAKFIFSKISVWTIIFGVWAVPVCHNDEGSSYRTLKKNLAAFDSRIFLSEWKNICLCYNEKFLSSFFTCRFTCRCINITYVIWLIRIQQRS